MPSDPKRVHLAYLHIRRIKAGTYPPIVGSSDDRHGPYRLVERPWEDVPEPSKLAILLDALDWSGITNRDQAHILLAEVDPGKLTDAQRNQLVDMAGLREQREPVATNAFPRMPDVRGQAARPQPPGKDKGIDR